MNCNLGRRHFACSRPAEDRTIPLSAIAERTKLSVEDVEHLLMKSLSVSELLFVIYGDITCWPSGL